MATSLTFVDILDWPANLEFGYDTHFSTGMADGWIGYDCSDCRWEIKLIRFEFCDLCKLSFNRIAKIGRRFSNH